MRFQADRQSGYQLLLPSPAKQFVRLLDPLGLRSPVLRQDFKVQQVNFAAGIQVHAKAIARGGAICR